MMSYSWRGALAVFPVALGLGCAGSGDEVELVGTRADGLTVVCSPDDPDNHFACDPQDAKTPGGRTDDCRSWDDGGAAIVLWPPNHTMERVTLAECALARSGCAASAAIAAAGHIIAVTSDEPLEANGDGTTPSGDLLIVDAQSVELRSERQGGSDGRVYRIESEDAEGHRDFCEVHVPHDRGPYGGARDSGEAVRIGATE